MPEITPEMYLPSEQTNDGAAFSSPEQLKQAHLNQMGQGLAQRDLVDHYMQGVSDKDIDNGTYTEKYSQAEHLLQQLIAQAASATDPAERARYNAKAEQKAAGLVGIQQGKKVDISKDETSVFEQLSERGMDVRGTLDYAANPS